MMFPKSAMLFALVQLGRVSVGLYLIASVFFQLLALEAPGIRPEHLGVPDLIPPLNTVVLALLWWRITRLEKDGAYFRDRIDKLRERDERRPKN